MTLIEWIILWVHVLILGTTIIGGQLNGDTVSKTMTRWGKRHNWFAFMFGAFCGHWFAPTRWLGWWGTEVWPWLLIPIALIGTNDLLNGLRVYKNPRLMRWPIWWFLLGLPAGMVFWQS